MVKEEEVKDLEKPCTKEEILEVLKGFTKEKSPRPDGWSVKFYLHYFDLVGQDLLDIVEETRYRGEVKNNINSTFITLIPKENISRKFEDFRLIPLCNLCYNLITKIIARRI